MGTVLGIGWACLDLRLRVASPPPWGERTPVEDLREVLGGPAAVAALAAARLGGGARLLSRRGSDLWGERLEALLAREGVQAYFLLGEQTPLSVVLVGPGGERWIFPHRGRLPQGAEGVDWERVLEGVGALVLDLRWPSVARQALEAARARGLPVVLDLDAADEEALRLAAQASHPIASAAVARAFGGVEALLEALPGFAAVTLGEGGVLWRGGRVPALPVEAQDTTGAGDVFHGAFAYGLAQGMGEEGALRLAVVASGLHVARGSPPTWEEVAPWLA